MQARDIWAEDQCWPAGKPAPAFAAARSPAVPLSLSGRLLFQRSGRAFRRSNVNPALEMMCESADETGRKLGYAFKADRAGTCKHECDIRRDTHQEMPVS